MLHNILLLLLVVFSASTMAQNSTNTTCDASMGTETLCNQPFYARCPNASLWVEKPQWQWCKECQLFWNYPRNILTVTLVKTYAATTTTRASSTIARLTTTKPAAPQVCLSKAVTGCTEVYRVLADGKLSKVVWKNTSSICFKNPIGNNYFKFQFQSPSVITCFGVFIKYWFK